ncbi:MAG: hypothetical protein GX591_02780 [Planctomycetes bacterium]|nr:hypothetical protein [Planctomycetota bacterium]
MRPGCAVPPACAAGLERLEPRLLLTAFISDDFSGATLNESLWQWVDPRGDGTVAVADGRLGIAVPGGAEHEAWGADKDAPRLMQAARDEDFELEVKFESQPAGAYAMQGVLVEAASGDYLRFDFHSSSSSQVRLFAAAFSDAPPSVKHNAIIAGGVPLYMRIRRQGDVWTQRYSHDGQTWLTGAAFTFGLEVSAVGVFAGNAGSSPPAYAAAVDYVFETSAPIDPEDGPAAPPPPADTTPPHFDRVNIAGGTTTLRLDFRTDEPADVVIAYGLTPACELGTVTTHGSPGIYHLGLIEGLDGGTVYHCRITAVDAAGNARVVTGQGATEGQPPEDTPSDTFDGTALDGDRWTVVDPLGDGTVAVSGGCLLLSVPGGRDHDVWDKGNEALRILQPVDDRDMDIVVKFDSAPSGAYATQGVLVEAAAGEFLRFDIFSTSATQLRLFAASFHEGRPTMRVNKGISASSPPLYLHVRRDGSTWTVAWSADGATLRDASSFTWGPGPAAVGVFAGNAGGSKAPAHTARVDAFMIDEAAPGPGPEPGEQTTFDLWYGDHQAFGQVGNPQRWINILGNASDSDGIASMTFTLNGGAPRPLSLGPDKRRLQAVGDFNVEIDRAELRQGTNTIVIRAVDGRGNVAATTVTVDFTGGVAGSFGTIRWSELDDLSDAVQVVDGKWDIVDGKLRTRQMGYDRLVAIGDVSWTDYEVVVPVTLHAIDPAGTQSPSNGQGIGLVMRWRGHYDWSGQQPTHGWWPYGALGWYKWSTSGDGLLGIVGSDAVQLGSDPATDLVLGVTYVWKMRVDTLGDGRSQYQLKVWPQSQAEPDAWNVTAIGDYRSLPSGSLMLVAHHVDASFGDVVVRAV